MRTFTLACILLLAFPLRAAEPPRPPEPPPEPPPEAAPADPYALTAEAFFALPETQRPLAPAPGGAPGTIDLPLLDAAVFHATNQVRVEHGLRPLTHDARLARAAEGHVLSMMEHGYLAHENPHDEAMRWPMQRVLATGYTPRAVSENLAQVFRVRYDDGRPYYRYERDGETIFSYEPQGDSIPPHTYESLARGLLKEWMDSPGHRENVLRPTSRELGAATRFRFLEDNLDEAISVQVFAEPMAK